MNKIEIIRQSPVKFSIAPHKTAKRNYWEVALEYKNETGGQYLADLSHFSRWDIQTKDIDKYKPSKVKIPTKAGDSVFTNSVLINRMNKIQASVWHLNKRTYKLPDELVYTDTTEVSVAIALFGKHTFGIAEKLSALDFLDPSKKNQFLLQGPFSHLSCQIVVFKTTISSIECGSSNDGILLTCARGYGHSLIHAILDAGKDFNLQIAGENKFLSWIKNQKK